MKIIAFPNAHALAHVSRLLEISKILRTNGHQILFAGTGVFLEQAKFEGFQCIELPYISIELIHEAVRSKKYHLLYQYKALKQYIDAETHLLKKEKPDFVLLDNRPSARTAADFCGIPTMAVLNVHMSSYRTLSFTDISKFGYIGHLIQPVLVKFEQFLFDKIIIRNLNKIRKELNLKPYYANQHEEGDIALLTDSAEFNPTQQLATHAHLVGPITWKNQLPAPTCLQQLDPDRKTLYFSLGSASLQELLMHLAPLTKQGIQLIVAYGKFDDNCQTLKLPPHIYLEEYVNTDILLPYCDLVCCHGGNGTLYQALNHGLPIVAVATHDEQWLGANQIETLGLGYCLKLNDIKRQGFSQLISHIESAMFDETMKNRCKIFSNQLKNYDGENTASQLIEIFMKS